MNEKKVDVKLIGPIAEKVGDTKELEGAVEENIIPQYTDKDQDKAYFVNKDTTDAIRRENLSRMYAYALTLRTNMAKTRKEGASDDKPVEAKDSREICSRRQPGKPWKTPGALPTSGICRRRFTNCS